MSAFRTALASVVRLDAAEVLRSRWLALSIGVYGVLGVVLVLVGLRESTVVGFTGSGRVLVSLTHALLVLLPLLALTATGHAVNRAREDGTLELLLSQPIPRSAWFLGVTLVRYAALVAPLFVVLLAVAIYGRFVQGQALPWAHLLRSLVVSAAVLWAFAGLGLLVSTTVRHQARAMMHLLLIWILAVALLDFTLAGMMLQWRLPARLVFVLAGLNPVQAARMALLSSADPELSVLGPVGFYLANRIGARALLVLRVAWPVVVGGASWLLALSSFRRSDVT
jgi:ABC-2 type transport system permease protein